MFYNILLHLSAFLATKHIVIIDLAFSSPLNDPPRGANDSHEGVTNESHRLLEGKVEEKDYDTNIIEVMNLNIQYKSQHGKNEQELKREQVRCQKGHAKQCLNK